MMDFNDMDQLRKFGFTGFLAMKELRADKKKIPPKRGVYIVLDPNYLHPSFVIPGVGGSHKSKNPNVSAEVLTKNWVKGARIVYIGKTGGSGSKETLRKRLSTYLRFGLGNEASHWGGRYIWQLKDSHELVIAWKELSSIEPRRMEQRLLKAFVNQFGKRPFANLKD